MKMLKRNQRVCLLVAIGVALMAFGPAAVMAGGEPGTGCGLEGMKYDPAPYIGDVTVSWVAGTTPGLGDVSFTGTVDQAGKTGCSGSFDGVYLYDISYDYFRRWNPSFLRLSCIENIAELYEPLPFPCVLDDASLEVIGVGGMKWLDDYSFTAKFIIMALQ